MIEILNNVYLKEGLRIPKPLNRISKSGVRYYFDNNCVPKMGITSFLSKVLPTNEFLIQWRIDNADAEKIKTDRADYGTMFHAFAAEMLRLYTTTGKIFYDTDTLYGEASMYCKKIGKTFYWQDYYELRGDLLSLVAWIKQYDPECILIETSLQSTDMQLAATLDLVAKINIETKGFYGEVYKSGVNKGEPKESKQIERVLAVIDFKTMIKSDTDEPKSNKQISLSNIWQLNYQRKFLLQNYPEFEHEKIFMFNAIPSDWCTNPAIQLSEIQTIPDKQLYSLYELSPYLGLDLSKAADKKIADYSGKFESEISDCMNIRTLKEIMQKEIHKKF